MTRTPIRLRQATSVERVKEFIESSANPTICFDIDGVLARTVSALIADLNPVLGTDYKYEHVTEMDISLCLGPEFGALAKKRFLEPDFYTHIEAGRNAMHAMQQLAKEAYNIIIVTDRAPHCTEVTQKWLNDNGATYDYLVVGGFGAKRNLVENYSGTSPLVIIDDNVTMAEVIHSPHIYLMVPQIPCTIGKVTPSNNIVHFKLWQHVLDKINSLDFFNQQELTGRVEQVIKVS